MLVNTGSGFRSEQLVSNVGLGVDEIVVPDTGTYMSADERESKRFVAGARIPVAEALRFGIVTQDDVTGVPASTAGDPIVGEQIAEHLRAAGYNITGYALSSATDFVTATPAEQAAGVTGVDDQAAADADASGDADEQLAVLEAEGAPKWYLDYARKTLNADGELVERESDETEKSFNERLAKVEESASNKAEDTSGDSNKSE